MSVELGILISVAGVIITYLVYQANKQKNEANKKNIK